MKAAKAVLAASVHCPMCDSVSVFGRGQLLLQGNCSLVEYYCKDCGEIFLMHDRREPRPEINT